MQLLDPTALLGNQAFETVAFLRQTDVRFRDGSQLLLSSCETFGELSVHVLDFAQLCLEGLLDGAFAYQDVVGGNQILTQPVYFLPLILELFD